LLIIPNWKCCAIHVFEGRRVFLIDFPIKASFSFLITWSITAGKDPNLLLHSFIARSWIFFAWSHRFWWTHFKMYASFITWAGHFKKLLALHKTKVLLYNSTTILHLSVIFLLSCWAISLHHYMLCIKPSLLFVDEVSYECESQKYSFFHHFKFTLLHLSCFIYLFLSFLLSGLHMELR